MLRVLGAVGVSIFLGGCCNPGPAKPVASETLVKSSSSWDGSRLPAYPRGQPEVTVMKITIPPGTRLPMHQHPVINAGVLLKGQLVVTTAEGRTLKLETGDALIEVVGKWHFGTNPGKVPAEILVVYAGVKGTPVTVKKD